MKKSLLASLLSLAMPLLAFADTANPPPAAAPEQVSVSAQAVGISLSAKPTLSVKKIVPADDPEMRTQQSIKAFTKVKTPKEGKTLDAAAKKENAATFKELDGFFGWDPMIQSVLKPHLDKLTQTEEKKIHSIFRDAVRLVSYPASGAFFEESEWKIQEVHKNDVTIFAFFPEEDLEMESTFHWKKVDGILKIVDLSIDGDSLVQDYRNQFGRIIAKHGAKGLIERLTKARDKEKEATQGLLP